MVKRKMTAILMAAALSGAGFAASAGPPTDQDVEAYFNNLDADGDGFVGEPETEGYLVLRAEWPRYDSDQDRQLSKEEFATFAEDYGLEEPQPPEAQPPEAAEP